MGISKQIRNKIKNFNSDEIQRLIRMGWEDRSTFESIQHQFSISPNEFVRLMRRSLDRKTFDRWRKRVHEQGHLKNETKRGFKDTRFKCTRQSTDGITKGWK